LKPIIISLSLFVLAGILVCKESRIKRPEGFSGEACLFCHKEMSDSDRSHPAAAFGCSSCHLGNPYSFDEKRAHTTRVKNPGDLRVVEITCGKSGCHGEIAGRVKKSLMATNRGILRIVQDEWGNGDGGEAVSAKPLAVRDFYGIKPPANVPLDLYRKMCGGCHLWKKKEGANGEVGRRGGGCSDCHVVDGKKVKNPEGLLVNHPQMTTRIPSENCVKCHNRSARIGLSYFGKFESAGYGTPYEADKLSGRRLSGNRFYLDLPADIHFEKGKMVCIDCHTATGLMGDGRSYDKMADQVDITCEACHSPRFEWNREAASLDCHRDPKTMGLGEGILYRNGGKRVFRPTHNASDHGPGLSFPLDGFVTLGGRPLQAGVKNGVRPFNITEIDRILSVDPCLGCHDTYEDRIYQDFPESMNRFETEAGLPCLN